MENWKGLKNGRGRENTLGESQEGIKKEDVYREEKYLNQKNKGAEKVKSKQKGERGENNTFREDDDFE